MVGQPSIIRSDVEIESGNGRMPVIQDLLALSDRIHLAESRTCPSPGGPGHADATVF